MQKLIAAIAMSICLVIALAASSSAAVVVYYSKVDNTYGWCANGSFTYCENSADDSCVGAGGKDCQFVLECSGGWGAMAFAEGDVSGFGASCHTSGASSARRTALQACILASNAFCWTNSTFSTGGRQSSDASNLEFDQTYYAQVLLNRAGLFEELIDGSMGPKTRAAVRSFQTSIGLEPTGVIDDRLIELLTYAGEGEQPGVDAIIESAKSDADNLAKFTYGYVTTPRPRLSFSAQLANMAEDKQRTALAVKVAINNFKCTLPASKVDAVNVDDGAWNVDCAEGPYFLLLSDTATIITVGHGNADTPPGPTTPGPNSNSRTNPNANSHTNPDTAAPTNIARRDRRAGLEGPWPRWGNVICRQARRSRQGSPGKLSRPLCGPRLLL